MKNNSPEAWLTEEAAELLDQGNVGLFQFIWELRSGRFGLSDAEAIQLSRRVVEKLILAGKAEIYALAWPGLDIIDGPLPLAVLDDPKNWSEGESGPMIGLVPNDSSVSAGARSG
jgi:hypothetical protein